MLNTFLFPGYLLDTSAENMTESLISDGLVELKRSGLKQSELVVFQLCYYLVVISSDSMVQPPIDRDRFRNVSNLELVSNRIGTQYMPALDCYLLAL